MTEEKLWKILSSVKKWSEIPVLFKALIKPTRKSNDYTQKRVSI